MAELMVLGTEVLRRQADAEFPDASFGGRVEVDSRSWITFSSCGSTSRFTDKRALAITLCWVAALAVTGSTEALLFLAPALLIVDSAARRPLRRRGADRQARREASPSAAARPRPPRLGRSRQRLESWRPRGTGLIAFSLAKRPPPARLLTQN